MNYKWLLFSFSGRIGRQTYWLFSLGFFLFYLVLSLLLGPDDESLGAILMFLVMIPTVYVGLAVAAKRWHDRNKSGWWSLIGLVPFIGGIWMLIELGFLAGTRGPNRFGPDPISPLPVVYEGQTYYRQSNGSFTDAFGNPVTNAVLIGALGAAYLAAQPATPESWSNSGLDSSDGSSPASTTEASSSSGSWWSSGSSAGGNDGWSSGGDSGGDSGGGGDGGGGGD